MNTRHLTGLLDAARQRIPEILDDAGFKADTCILATRVANVALRDLGVSSSPMTTRLNVCNAQYAAFMDRWAKSEHADDDMPPEGWLAEAAGQGAWRVSIGHGVDPNAERPGYDGHVVLAVQRRYILDLTLGQASRPHKDIALPRAWWFTDPSFITGRVPYTWAESDDSARVVYLRHDNESYLRAPDWLKVRPSDQLVRNVRRALTDSVRRAA